MSDEQTSHTQNPEGEHATKPHGDQGQGTDWKAEARKWEARSKENRTAAEELARLKEASMSAQEKAARHTKDLEDRLHAYESERQQRDWCAQVSEDTGVPANVLRGSSLEAVQEHAKALKELIDPGPTAPAVPGQASQPESAQADARHEFVARLFNN